MTTVLTDKQRAFVSAYLGPDLFNAHQAALRAGYAKKSARQMASENLTKPNIRAVIERRMRDLAMTADEVLARLAMHARNPDPQVSMRALELVGKSHGLYRQRVEVMDWRREIEQAGIPASELFEDLIKTIHARMKDAGIGE